MSGDGGLRSWRGCRTLQCLVCRGGDVRSIQLVENLMREDLQPIEQAKAYKEMMKKEGWKVRELARNLHLEHSRVAKALKLLELPASVQKAVDKGAIARPLRPTKSPRRPKAEHRQLARDAAAGKIKGDDLRQKPAPAPAPTPRLTLASPPVTHQAWKYEHGKTQVTVTGYRDKKELITALERALASARAARLPLLGGLGN